MYRCSFPPTFIMQKVNKFWKGIIYYILAS